MAILPIRGLGSAGIFKDPAPYNLPLTAWSNGNNVRFENGRVRRAPSFRTIDATGTEDPVFMYGARPSIANDFIIYTLADGSIYKFAGSHIDATHVDYTPTTNALPFSATILDNVVYVNRKSHVPYYLGATENETTPLSDAGWDSTWRAGVIRSFKDYLLALDVTKGAVEYPNMVKWSAPVTGSASPPSSWDETDPTTGAGENPLPEMEGRILDGGTLKDKFIIYSNNDVWGMILIGGTLIFDFQKLFDDEGILMTNGFIEVDGKHFVWGENDIYVHDGISKRSIVDGSNREFIFNGMDKNFKDRFFIAFDPILDEVLFFYVSNDIDAEWQNTTYPNRIAAYNIKDGSWAFRDAPAIVGAAELIYTEVVPWDDDDNPWNSSGGSWDGTSDQNRTALLMMRREESDAGLSGTYIYGYDTVGDGSVISFPLDEDATPPAFVERVGIDMDEVGAEIRVHKIFDRIYPQARIFEDTPIEISVGSQMTAWGPEITSEWLSFNPDTQYKLDFRRGGRYLSLRIRQTSPVDFWFSGADVDLKTHGRR